jgi:hypothetical protein
MPEVVTAIGTGINEISACSLEGEIPPARPTISEDFDLGVRDFSSPLAKSEGNSVIMDCFHVCRGKGPSAPSAIPRLGAPRAARVRHCE